MPYNSATTLTGPYMVPALAMDVVATHTNKAPVSSVRGAGYPQAAFAMERLMDRLAHALGIDRAELRRRNLIPAEKMPYLKPLKARAGEQVQYDSGDYPGCQAEILSAAGLGRFPAPPGRSARAGPLSSASGWRTASRAPAAARSNSAACACRRPAASRCSTGAAAMGQGLATALAQICAESFGVRARGCHASSPAIPRRRRSASAASPAGRR